MINFFIYIFIFLGVLNSQEQIGEGLYNEDLINYLFNNYKTTSTLSYDNARDILYSEVDLDNGNVYCIYTDYYVSLPGNVDPSTYLYENGMNCEHVWPQSMYEVITTNIMKSDMHHLRPCKENANSYRNNKPFGESIDNQTNNWLWQSYNLTSIPSSNINEYTENGDGIFEPRESVKGNIARSMFYFYTIYPNEADEMFFEEQKQILFDWHNDDPIENDEITRTWNIATYQNNIPNPFVLDSTLIYRAYFYSEEFLIGDVNQDTVIDIVDVILIVNFMLGYYDFDATQIQLADINNDGIINVVDIVAIISIILST